MKNTAEPSEPSAGSARSDRAVRWPVIVIMGVSGSGKTTIGGLLAERLGREYADADEFHPPANIEKMRAGRALDDDDRRPWLARIVAWIDDHMARGTPGVVSCSSLKRRYRDALRRPQVRLVFLDGDRELIARRLAARRGHFFAAAMLDGQLRDLERPGPDESVLSVSVDGTPAQVVQRIVEGL